MGRKICVVLLVAGLVGVISLATSENADARRFTDDFMLEECGGFSNTGSNPFFILEPDYLLVLEGQEGRKTLRVTITVLNETKTVHLDIDGVPTDVITRVIEERETKDDVLVEISRNYFAICDRTNSVMYFGEAVDIYNKEGTEVISHEGAWEAGVDEGAMPGIIMPGTLLKGGGFGLLGNIIVGVIGAVVGGFLFGLLGMAAGGLLGSIVTATVGAVVLLFLVGLLKKA